MIIGYSDYVMSTCTVSGSQTPPPTILTPIAALDDARTGIGTSFTFTGGVQSTSVYAQLVFTVLSNGLDAVPVWNCVGIANVVGLPAGTLVKINSLNPGQRLAPNERGELGAWFLFGPSTGATGFIQFFNDVNGGATLTAGQVFSIGEIFVGRAIALPTLAEQGMRDDLHDISQYNRSNGQQLYQVMRKPWREYAQILGRFTTAQARGMTKSNLPNGAPGANTIDLQTLRAILSTTRKCAVCDVPWQGFASFPSANLINGYKADAALMQANWMVSKMTNPGSIYMDGAPLQSWNPTFQEAL